MNDAAAVTDLDWSGFINLLRSVGIHHLKNMPCGLGGTQPGTFPALRGRLYCMF